MKPRFDDLDALHGLAIVLVEPGQAIRYIDPACDLKLDDRTTHALHMPLCFVLGGKLARSERLCRLPYGRRRTGA